jgi:glycine/D-amino acid oxidase-like deaminating enzyme
MLIARNTDVTVLGAGLTGTCAALELANAGVAVTLIEQDERAINRASLRNEGKIHLGFVFSQDLTEASSRLQLHGALRFRRLLSRLIGEGADTLRLSHPFVYLVPNDSIATPDELEARFANLDGAYRDELANDPDLDYFGRRPDALSERIPLVAVESHIRPEPFQGAFLTEEIAIDTQELADLVQAAVVAHPNIDFRPGHLVHGVERRTNGFRIEGSSADGI